MSAGASTETGQALRGDSSLSLVPTFVVVAVDATGLGIILPLLPFYSQRLGATAFLLGMLISAYAVCQLIAGPVVGMLSDRYGRRKASIMATPRRYRVLIYQPTNRERAPSRPSRSPPVHARGCG